MKPSLVVRLLLVLTLVASHASAQEAEPTSLTVNAGLTKEVREAERLTKALRASADKVDHEVWIGTMYNEVDLAEHTCYALGMLLGLETSVRHLRFERHPTLTARNSDQAHDLRVKAQSLDNFLNAAASSLKMSPGQRGIAWNLDCSGQYRIARVPLNTTGESTFYEVTNGGRGLKILGAIEKGFAAKLRATLEAAPQVEFVALGSGGGSVAEAITAGKLIRSKGLATTVWNSCYSACPLVFLGGVDRQVHSPYPSFGFHQISTSAGAIPTDSPVYRRVAEYIREMGADDRFVVAAMLRATPTQMNMINGANAKLCQARIATWVQRSCEAGR